MTNLLTNPEQVSQMLGTAASGSMNINRKKDAANKGISRRLQGNLSHNPYFVMNTANANEASSNVKEMAKKHKNVPVVAKKDPVTKRDASRIHTY